MPADLEKARRHLKEKKFNRAIRELKKTTRSFPDNRQAHFLLARAYVSLGKQEKSKPYFILAEGPLRKAIKLDPFREKYHDLMMEVKMRQGKLDELSSEYRSKKDKNPNPLYDKMLKKISTVSVLSIPQPEKDSGGGKHKGYYFIHYMLMPVVAAAAVAMWILEGFVPLRNGLTLIVVLYVTLRIFLRPSSKKYEKW